MTTLSKFKERLRKLTATKTLDDEILDVYIEDALTAFSEHNPERVLMKKVPVDAEKNGFYDVPADADSVVKVYVHNTDIEIEFSTEQDSATNVEQIRLGSIVRPSTLFIEGHYDPPIGHAVSGARFDENGTFDDYDYFDIAYFRQRSIERLNQNDLRTVQLYVEYLGYENEASKTENLVDITDQDSSGDSTTLRRSNIGKQWLTLSQQKKEAFEQRAIRPYGTRSRTYAFQYNYGQII